MVTLIRVKCLVYGCDIRDGDQIRQYLMWFPGQAVHWLGSAIYPSGVKPETRSGGGVPAVGRHKKDFAWFTFETFYHEIIDSFVGLKNLQFLD